MIRAHAQPDLINLEDSSGSCVESVEPNQGVDVSSDSTSLAPNPIKGRTMWFLHSLIISDH